VRAKPTRTFTDVEEERAVPWGDAGNFAWHLARYEFAVPFVKEKCVLDLGSGEGYGAALLAEHAREVVGIDYSPEAVKHARARYARGNLSFDVGDAMAIPNQLGHFDVVTCFEVIEHVEDHGALLAGIARALRPGGVVLLSTPNKRVDELFESVSRREHYEYHINMLTPKQLRRHAGLYFSDIRLYGQTASRNAFHRSLKTVDVLNLRHRVVRSARMQRALLERMSRQGDSSSTASCRFSRVLARQSPVLVLIAWKSQDRV
jgi:2-polyprenyl-3-methyl-5-hydroxy-6-metoxy-1,4-benzoquinol methylase